MQREMPRWLRTAMLALAVILLVFGVLAWSYEHRVQSGTLFSFSFLLLLEWFFVRSRFTSKKA